MCCVYEMFGDRTVAESSAVSKSCRGGGATPSSLAACSVTYPLSLERERE
eukprot:COSAG03_NODE_14791_length_452_cov_0.719547_2_plen_49_part_01